eukprot:TRINITY_DN1786_c0_g1_i1.p1 TRINITY_DN1786_c0_g1~~TRINITY_DN1786_c0_g1_i1.p1  ORF type:complete len:1061 (-),score=225.32 TRINITY_DN1786_c0_g1_i1:826-4008(-)
MRSTPTRGRRGPSSSSSSSLSTFYSASSSSRHTRGFEWTMPDRNSSPGVTRGPRNAAHLFPFLPLATLISICLLALFVAVSFLYLGDAFLLREGSYSGVSDGTDIEAGAALRGTHASAVARLRRAKEGVGAGSLSRENGLFKEREKGGGGRGQEDVHPLNNPSLNNQRDAITEAVFSQVGQGGMVVNEESEADRGRGSDAFSATRWQDKTGDTRTATTSQSGRVEEIESQQQQQQELNRQYGKLEKNDEKEKGLVDGGGATGGFASTVNRLAEREGLSSSLSSSGHSQKKLTGGRFADNEGEEEEDEKPEIKPMGGMQRGRGGAEERAIDHDDIVTGVPQAKLQSEEAEEEGEERGKENRKEESRITGRTTFANSVKERNEEVGRETWGARLSGQAAGINLREGKASDWLRGEAASGAIRRSGEGEEKEEGGEEGEEGMERGRENGENGEESGHGALHDDDEAPLRVIPRPKRDRSAYFSLNRAAGAESANTASLAGQVSAREWRTKGHQTREGGLLGASDDLQIEEGGAEVLTGGNAAAIVADSGWGEDPLSEASILPRKKSAGQAVLGQSDFFAEASSLDEVALSDPLLQKGIATEDEWRSRGHKKRKSRLRNTSKKVDDQDLSQETDLFELEGESGKTDNENAGSDEEAGLKGADDLDKIWESLTERLGEETTGRTESGGGNRREHVDSLDEVWEKHFKRGQEGGRRFQKGVRKHVRGTPGASFDEEVERLWQEHFDAQKGGARVSRISAKSGERGGLGLGVVGEREAGINDEEGGSDGEGVSSVELSKRFRPRKGSGLDEGEGEGVEARSQSRRQQEEGDKKMQEEREGLGEEVGEQGLLAGRGRTGSEAKDSSFSDSSSEVETEQREGKEDDSLYGENPTVAKTVRTSGQFGAHQGGKGDRSVGGTLSSDQDSFGEQGAGKRGMATQGGHDDDTWRGVDTPRHHAITNVWDGDDEDASNSAEELKSGRRMETGKSETLGIRFHGVQRSSGEAEGEEKGEGKAGLRNEGSSDDGLTRRRLRQLVESKDEALTTRGRRRITSLGHSEGVKIGGWRKR